tara:strand:- start:237 stop:734 length:498 start_codon:yes stop_codon:yes gene_type:complete
MANAHENIDNLTILNDLDKILKRTYKDTWGYPAEEKKYNDRQDITTKILGNQNISDILSLFVGRNQWESGNIQKGIGIDDIHEPLKGYEITSPLSDSMLKTIATPNMLGDLSKLLTGIYDPQSEANIAGVRDVEGERKLGALRKTTEAIHGDDENILDVIKALQG